MPSGGAVADERQIRRAVLGGRMADGVLAAGIGA
jgi:hypothetical protein